MRFAAFFSPFISLRVPCRYSKARVRLGVRLQKALPKIYCPFLY